jgi:carbonic anhydrase/acetyltransferase-like protein (isoleucine patch superfamily)
MFHIKDIQLQYKKEQEMIDKKYKLGEAKLFTGRIFFRIIALKEFSDVSIGDIGGWIQTENNLSHYDNAWVYNEAHVSDNATILGNAKILDNARIYGNAKIYCDAIIYDNAEIGGNTVIYNNAQVYQNARVYSNAEIGDNVQVYKNALVNSNAQLYGDAICTKAANVIYTSDYTITISDNFIKIGCQNHSIDDWYSFTDEQISKMACNALTWWKIWKPILFAIIDAY